MEPLFEGEGVEAGVAAFNLVVAEVGAEGEARRDAEFRAAADLAAEQEVTLTVGNAARCQLGRCWSEAADLRSL